MIFIIKGFQTIVFVFIVISTKNNNKDEDNSSKTLNDECNLFTYFFILVISVFHNYT